MATTTFTINGVEITCDQSVVGAIVAEFCNGSTVSASSVKPRRTSKRTKTSTANPRKSTTVRKSATVQAVESYKGLWYGEFESPHTTVTVGREQVKVKVERGYADEWHDKLRAAGFTWSKKGFWWAYLDSAKRQKVADRHIAADAATAGMSKDERREYWRNRNAQRNLSIVA